MEPPRDAEKTLRPLMPPRQSSTTPSTANSSFVDLMDKKEIERLGRVRPECFKSLWSEVGFVCSICMAQILVEYFVSGFNILVPAIVKALQIPESSSTWPASAFSLVLACFLLPMGRLSDMFGGKRMFVIGVGWLVIWSIIAGLSRRELLLDCARGLSGLGPAAFLPSSVKLLGSVYRPGPRKNLVFSLYGACAPLGFFVGIFFAGVSAQLLSWRWYFFIGAGLTAVSFFMAWGSMPSDADDQAKLGVKMDWMGSVLIVSGLIFVVYGLTDLGHATQGVKSPQILATLCAGIVILGVAVWWEGWIAKQPLLPVDIFQVKMFPAVVGAMFMQYGGLGIFLLYTAFYMDGIMGGTPLQIVAWTTPMCVGGIIIAAVGGFVLHLVSGTIMMLVAGVNWIIAPLLFALMPPGGNYWAFVLPAMVTGTIGIDISFNITNIFITTGLPKRQQGLAGAIINSNMHLSIAFFLGLADVIKSQVKKNGASIIQQYRDVFWFEIGLASVALLIMLAFVRLDSAKSDMTADEKEQLREMEKELSSSQVDVQQAPLQVPEAVHQA